MTFNTSYDFYCYRANVSNKRAGLPISPKKTSFSQNIKAVDTEENYESPAVLKNKQNICQCRAQNWNSIVDHYNDENTTVVWKNGSPVSEKPIENNRKFKLKKNKESYKVTTTNLKSSATKDENNNTIELKEKKIGKRKITEVLKNAEFTKVCQQGVCKTNREEGKEHRCKCKQNKKRPLRATCTDNSCKPYGMCNMTKSCIEFFYTLFKKQNTAKKQNPVFAIRVDSSSLNVLNPNETKTKVKTFGTLSKNDKCLCPSRLEKEKKYGIGETCSGGVCESARRGKYDKFNCHCAKTALIECCDTICDNFKPRKGRLTKTANLVRNRHKKDITPIKSNKPLFEMVLDNNHMNVLNTGEIYEVLRKASKADMCPTGVCRATAGKNRILNCKCLSKKIAPILHECNKITCQPNETTDKSKKKSKFYICTRICSSLQNWTCRKNCGDLINQINNNGIHRLSNKKEKQLQQSNPPKRVKKAEVQQRKNVQDTGQGDANIQVKKKQRQRKKAIDSKLKGKPKKSKKIVKRRNFKIKRSFRKNTMSKKMRETEKEVSKSELKKEKLNIKKEKQKEKEAKKRKKKIEHMHSKEENKLNFLATFVIGTVNLSLQTIRGILTAVITIITSPTRSYIYAKRRIRDPIGTCKIFKSWFTSTWSARDTKISSIVQESNAIDILSDHFENSALFETFANKGQTPQERQIYERTKKRRVKRIRKRNDQAMHSCRHTLLLTLRKHPCIWVYHICPFYYPQFLAMREFVKNFFHLLLYLAALICWTPCIMCVEIVRAFFCCIACSQ